MSNVTLSVLNSLQSDELLSFMCAVPLNERLRIIVQRISLPLPLSLSFSPFLSLEEVPSFSVVRLECRELCGFSCCLRL